MLRSRRIVLLGLKQRGFGENMYNSFGGNENEGEDFDECACQESLEETDIKFICVTRLVVMMRIQWEERRV